MRALSAFAMLSYLIQKLDGERRLGFLTWFKFVIESMPEQILDYPTFSKLISLLRTKEKAKPAVDLLRSMFLGFFDYVRIYDDRDKSLVSFLVAEGVLTRDEETKNRYKMSSIFVDELIR